MNKIRCLQNYQEREFFPTVIEWNDITALQDFYQKLLNTTVEVDAEAKTWLSSWRELDSIIHQEYCIRYVEMTCNTEDKKSVENLEFFSQKIIPLASEMNQKLIERTLSTPILRDRLQAEVPLYFKDIEVDNKIFRLENIAIFTEIENFTQQYKKISAAQTAEWDGKNITLLLLRKQLENTSRNIREKAFRVEMERRRKDCDVLDTIFSEIIERRQKIAKNSGFTNFRDYVFLQKHRYDYSPEECFAFHQAIKETIVPLLQKVHQARKKKLKLDRLRPWDSLTDITGEEPISPCKDGKDLENKIADVFATFDPELNSYYQVLRKNSLFDLDNRKGKAPGGYQIFFTESRMPFIFMNAVGVHRDVITLLHESGHAFHALLANDQDYFQRNAPMEFCEVASMSMELMTLERVSKVFGEKIFKQLERQVLQDIPNILIRVAMIDSFQHWLYTNMDEARNAEKRHQKWLELHREYLPEIDLEGIEDICKNDWHRVLHIFELPFYYIEYAIAELGAIQFWLRFLENKQDTLQDYKTALRAGGSLGLKDLFARANLEWSLQETTIKKVSRRLEEKLLQVTGA